MGNRMLVDGSNLTPRRATSADIGEIAALVCHAAGTREGIRADLCRALTGRVVDTIRRGELWVVRRHETVVGAVHLILWPRHYLLGGVVTDSGRVGRTLRLAMFAFAEAEAVRNGCFEIRTRPDSNHHQDVVTLRGSGYFTCREDPDLVRKLLQPGMVPMRLAPSPPAANRVGKMRESAPSYATA